ncbi:MAG: DNA polymerase Y family protein, partial [Micrococcales bacterium]|nr:DNA polymerase Y family protein [Micrococcales bacterium]
APAQIPDKPWPASLLDSQGRPVKVSATLELSGSPHHLDGELVQDWAGPWPVVERWWSHQPSRRVYLQVARQSGAALLACQDGAWQIEGVYD